MIIGISGKIGSGKDTCGKIIQYLTLDDFVFSKTNADIIADLEYNGYCANKSNWQIKKFAYKLKQIVSILTGIPVEDLEKQEVKNRILGEEWWRYKSTIEENFIISYNDGVFKNIHKSPEKHGFELEKPTLRQLLQEIGTEAMRNIIHPNVWINALFADYKHKSTGKYYNDQKGEILELPNWIITDLRFPNELEAVKQRNGITIRVNKFIKKTSKEWQELYPDIKVLDPDGWSRGVRFDFEWNQELISLQEYQNKVMRSTCKFKVKFEDYFKQNEHPSETALDNVTFDYTIENNGTIEELIEKVREILLKEKII